jgi:dimethylargininase
VNYLGKDTLLITSALAEYPAFSNYEKIILDTGEEYAANTLWINDTMLLPKGFPKTHNRLSRLGMTIIVLDVSEVQKMDGGLTCMSLRF